MEQQQCKWGCNSTAGSHKEAGKHSPGICVWHRVPPSLFTSFSICAQCKKNNFPSWASLTFSVPVILVAFLNFPKDNGHDLFILICYKFWFFQLEQILNIMKLNRSQHIKMRPQEVNTICCSVCVAQPWRREAELENTPDFKIPFIPVIWFSIKDFGHLMWIEDADRWRNPVLL